MAMNVNRLTDEVLLKYLDSFDMILTADLILLGENSTKGNTIKYIAISMYAKGRMLAIYL